MLYALVYTQGYATYSIKVIGISYGIHENCSSELSVITHVVLSGTVDSSNAGSRASERRQYSW